MCLSRQSHVPVTHDSSSATRPYMLASSASLLQALQPPRPATGVSRALWARSVPGVSLQVSLGPFGRRAPECPKSVPGVSRECPRSVRTPFLTLRRHFLDTPEPGARRAPETPRGTFQGPRDSCSRPGCNSSVSSGSEGWNFLRRVSLGKGAFRKGSTSRF